VASRLVWEQTKVKTASELVVMRNMTRAAIFVEGVIIRSLSVGQPVKRLKSGRLVGLGPSSPGQPPHVLMGGLRRSVTHKVFKAFGNIVALVGSNMKYARRLELGFIGSDSKGRMYNQGPRPYLRPAVRNNRSAIMRFVMGK
jgi:hypothetical protein